MKRIIYQIAVLCMVLAGMLCMGHNTKVQAAASLNQKNVTICKGGKTVLALNGTQEPVTWATSNKGIAKVSAKGVVTGVKKGKATITARVGKETYRCHVVVNDTYGAETSSVVLKREGSVMLTFTKDAVVTYKIQDPEICSAGWGSWDGNEIPLYITPKKVGVTYITCSNGLNNETVRIRVRVKKVPVKVTNIRAVTDDGGDFVCGENTARLSFKQDRASKNTVLHLISRNGETIRTMGLGAVPAGKAFSVSWDGSNGNGVNYQGEFRIKVVADGYTTRNWHYYKCYAISPFQRGNGTKEKPYEVATAEQLERIAGFGSRHFVQVQDIDLRSDIISSLFSKEHPFNGSYQAKPSDIGFRILHYNGNTSLFGVIGTEGKLDNVTVSEARITGTGQERSAVLAEINQGEISGCTVEQAVIYSASATEAALLAVENSGMIDRCRAHGTVYSYGSMAGAVVYNHQRIVRTGSESTLNLSAAGGITAGQDIFIGGIAAVNGQSAFIDACESSSSLQAAGTLQASAKLYLGGISGKNLGQIRDGNAFGHFPLENTDNMVGDVQGGIIAGINDGMITGVAYYETDGRKASAAGSGREHSLKPIENAVEEV